MSGRLMALAPLVLRDLASVFAFLIPIFSRITLECRLSGNGISFSMRASSSIGDENGGVLDRDRVCVAVLVLEAGLPGELRIGGM